MAVPMVDGRRSYPDPAGEATCLPIETVDASAGGASTEVVDTAGILTGVPAGTHTVTIASRTATGVSSSVNNGGDVRVVAIALG